MKIKDIENSITVKFIAENDFDKSLSELISSAGFSHEESKNIQERVLEREKMLSTYFVDEAIVPRAEIEKNDDLKLLCGIVKDPIKLVSTGGSDIKIILLILYGSERKKDYLNLLSYMCRLLSGHQLKNRILSLEKEDEIKSQILRMVNEFEA